MIYKFLVMTSSFNFPLISPEIVFIKSTWTVGVFEIAP